MKSTQEDTSLALRHTDVTAQNLQNPFHCRTLTSVLARVGDKWSIIVIIFLKDGPLRFNELKRSIGSVSQRMLTLTLRGLERDGLVKRTITPIIPPRVDYELTELGHSLRLPVEALGQWTLHNRHKMEEARERYESASED